MKRNLLTLLVMFCVASNFVAQESYKAFSYGDEWMVYTKNGAEWIFLREKTAMNGLTYRPDYDRKFYYRQDGDKIYRYSVADDTEQLVIDYGLQVGDTFPLYEGFSLQVEAVSDTVAVFINWDEERLDSAVCKRLHLKGVEQPQFRDEWVEMFGSMCYGINPPAKAEDLGQSHLMYAAFGEFIHMCDFSLQGAWGMEAILGEEYPRSSEYVEMDPIEFSLRNDSLHIGGYIRNDCAGPLYILFERGADDISFSTYELPLDADCYSFFKIDISLSGFSKDKYTIKYRERTFEVTRGDVLIDPEQNEPYITPYHDLMGREVAHPTRGIYIKDGKKVVIK